MADSLPEDGITIKDLLDCLRERGLLMICMALTIRFYYGFFPGSSTPFGLVIALIGLGLIFKKIPWLPKNILNFRIAPQHLLPVLEKHKAFHGN